jgi:hypothetical protein
MKMKKMNKVVVNGFIVLFVLLASGCNLPSTSQAYTVEELVATYQQQTLDAGNGENGNGEQGEDVAMETETLQPTITQSPTVTLTPTQEKAMVSVSVDTNCRTGPGKIYDWIGGLLIGEQAEVVGQSMDGQYWIIKNPDRAGECWLWGNYATVTGPTATLKKYTPPPTPTPEFVWEGNWTIYTTDTNDAPMETYPMSVTLDGKDFTGSVDLGGGQTVTLTGTVSDDYLSVSGSWVGPTNNGPFNYFAVGSNQFNGNANNGSIDFGWCGSRGGAGQPSPCYKN